MSKLRTLAPPPPVGTKAAAKTRTALCCLSLNICSFYSGLQLNYDSKKLTVF